MRHLRLMVDRMWIGQNSADLMRGILTCWHVLQWLSKSEVIIAIRRSFEDKSLQGIPGRVKALKSNAPRPTPVFFLKPVFLGPGRASKAPRFRFAFEWSASCKSLLKLIEKDRKPSMIQNLSKRTWGRKTPGYVMPVNLLICKTSIPVRKK